MESELKFPIFLDFKNNNLYIIYNEYKNICIFKDKNFIILFELLNNNFDYFFENFNFEGDKFYKNFGFDLYIKSFNVDEYKIKDKINKKNDNNEDNIFKIIKIISNIYHFSFLLNLNFLEKQLHVKLYNTIKLFPETTIKLNFLVPLNIALYNKDDNRFYFNINEPILKNSWIGDINSENNNYLVYNIDGIYMENNIFKEEIDKIIIDDIKESIILSNFGAKRNLFCYCIMPIKIINKTQNIIDFNSIIIEQNELNIYKYNDIIISDILEYNFIADNKIVKEYKEYSNNFKYDYNLIILLNKREINEYSLIRKTMNILFQ